MAPKSLTRLPTSQTDDSNTEDDIPAYAAAGTHVKTGHNDAEESKPLTIQTFLAGQKVDANCCLLAECGNIPIN